jgi:uncharacterized protein YecT (DUF1311 family)
MTRVWLAAVALTVSLGAAGAAALDPVLNDPILSWNEPVPADCKNAGTTIALDSCAGTVFKKNYLAMVALYNGLAGKYDKKNRTLLQTAQRSWYKYMTDQCAFATAPTEGGTINAMIVTECKNDHTLERIKELKAQRDCQEGDMSCNHP